MSKSLMKLKEQIKDISDYKVSGFPLESPKVFTSNHKGGITIQLGLKSQGFHDFVKRAIEFNSGWNEISHAIGWVGCHIVHSYYNVEYKDYFDKYGLYMVNVIESPYINNYKWNEETNQLEKNQESGKRLSFFDKNHRIINVIEFSLKKDEDNNYAPLEEFVCPSIHKNTTSKLKRMFFQVELKKGLSTSAIATDTFVELVDRVLEMQKDGYERISDFYFDALILNNDEKCRVSNSCIKLFQKIGLK